MRNKLTNTKLIKTLFLLALVSIITPVLFMIWGCNNDDLGMSPDKRNITQTSYVNPLRNPKNTTRKIINSEDWLIATSYSTFPCGQNQSPPNLYIKRIVSGTIIDVSNHYFNGNVDGRIGLNTSGTVVTSKGKLGRFYGDSNGVQWISDFSSGLTAIGGLKGSCKEMMLSDYNELILFSEDSSRLVYYTVGIINTDCTGVNWVQINQPLNLPTTILSGKFAADLGGGYDDQIAFVYYNGSSEYRQNGVLNWYDGSYTITLTTSANRVTCGTPIFLDIALDNQNHCVWTQSEENGVYSVWLCTQPNKDVFNFGWKKVGADSEYRANPRIGISNGYAVIASQMYVNGAPNLLLTLYQAISFPPVKLQETYVNSDCRIAYTRDISF